MLYVLFGVNEVTQVNYRQRNVSYGTIVLYIKVETRQFNRFFWKHFHIFSIYSYNTESLTVYTIVLGLHEI